MGPVCHTDWVWTAADGAAGKQSHHSADAQLPGISLHRKLGSRVFVFHPARAINTKSRHLSPPAPPNPFDVCSLKSENQTVLFPS